MPCNVLVKDNDFRLLLKCVSVRLNNYLFIVSANLKKSQVDKSVHT